MNKVNSTLHKTATALFTCITCFLCITCVQANAWPSKKKQPEPVTTVRKRPPENIEARLSELVPNLAPSITSISRALCEIQGKVTSLDFTEALIHNNGPAILDHSLASLDLTKEVRGESYMARLAPQPYFSQLNLPQLYFKVTSQLQSAEWTASAIEFSESPPQQMLNRRDLIHVTSNSDCVPKGATIFRYDSDRYLQRVDFLTPEAEGTRPVYEPRKSLDEIYKNSKTLPLGKTKQDVLLIANRKDRTVVGIYDSGLDYNHPSIAYKMPQPLKPLTPEISQRLMDIRSALAKLNREKEVLRAQHAETPRTKQILIEADRLRTEARNYVVGWAFDRDDHLPFDFVYEPHNIYRQFADHGTHVAGIITKDTDDVAVVPLRYALYGDRDHRAAIQYAQSIGVKVINISLGTKEKYVFENFDRIIDEFKNILFVVAAGNDDKDITQEPVWPAAFNRPNMIVVGATRANGEYATGSNFGPAMVDLAAIGVDVHSLAPMALGGEATYSGTSQAAPQVTRAAAKMLYVNPTLSPIQIREILCRTADRSATLQSKVHCGLLNEQAALEATAKTTPINTHF